MKFSQLSGNEMRYNASKWGTAASKWGTMKSKAQNSSRNRILAMRYVEEQRNVSRYPHEQSRKMTSSKLLTSVGGVGARLLGGEGLLGDSSLCVARVRLSHGRTGRRGPRFHRPLLSQEKLTIRISFLLLSRWALTAVRHFLKTHFDYLIIFTSKEGAPAQKYIYFLKETR